MRKTEQQEETAKVDAVRSAYDHGRYIDALRQAQEILTEDPNNPYIPYVRRVAVTAACATGKVDIARRYYEQLSEDDKKLERARCRKYGVKMPE